MRREPYFGGLVVFFADRAAPDGYLESWAPGDSALSLASWEYYSDCTRVPTELTREFLEGQAGKIPAVPLESFEPGKYRPLAALGRSRLKDIWGLGYDDDEGLRRILQGTI